MPFLSNFQLIKITLLIDKNLKTKYDLLHLLVNHFHIKLKTKVKY